LILATWNDVCATTDSHHVFNQGLSKSLVKLNFFSDNSAVRRKILRVLYTISPKALQLPAHHNKVIPPAIENKIATPTVKARKSKVGALAPSLFLLLEVAVSVTVPLPALAVPVLSVLELPEF
jgi:hypothetical protein